MKFVKDSQIGTLCIGGIIIVGCFFWLSCSGADEAAIGSLDDCVSSYLEGDLPKAKRIAEKKLTQPLGRLVFYLCQINDSKNQNLTLGLNGLKELFEDRNVDAPICLEAQLSYTRTIALLQVRGRHKQYDSIEVEKLYLDLIKKAGSDEKACYAALYLAESYVDAYLKNPQQKSYQRGIDFLEGFIGQYSGDVNNLVFLHIYIEQLYSRFAQNYIKSFDHLEKAYQLGITSPMAKRDVLFKLGRISDIKINNLAKATNYYEEFLRLYPNEIRTPLVQRYLDTLTVPVKKP